MKLRPRFGREAKLEVSTKPPNPFSLMPTSKRFLTIRWLAVNACFYCAMWPCLALKWLGEWANNRLIDMCKAVCRVNYQRSKAKDPEPETDDKD